MSIEHRPDPNSFAGAEARRRAYNERGRRLSRLSAEPWKRLLIRTVITIVAIFAAASIVFWLASASRGY